MSFGKVDQVMGPSVDIEFGTDQLPKMLNAVTIDLASAPSAQPGESADKKSKLVLEVAQHIGGNVVRCIALATTDGLVRGMKATDTGAPISVPVGNQTLGRIFNLLGEPIDEQKNKPIDRSKTYPIHREPPSYQELLPVSEILETGI